MSAWSVTFEPLLPWSALAILATIGLALAGYGLWLGLRGAPLRLLAVVAVAAALANPIVTRENREPLTSVAALVVDRSQSQTLGDRVRETDAAREALIREIAQLNGIELREVTVSANAETSTSDGTRLFDALARALGDVPPDRVAGAILVTDGQVHDVPRDVAALGLSAPVHALVTGQSSEYDRRIVVDAVPRFGLVNSEQVLSFRVLDQGALPANSIRRTRVVVRRDGEQIATLVVPTGEKASVSIRIAHGGDNIVELEAEPIDGELTALNNRAVASIEGIRENLRVLLISGEPNPGERTWRNLLKSDASVDLVHFTILRPPEKMDSTPINELSLIAFPVRELFQEKIGEFDLIIFDRYQRRSILPSVYFDNIARYVRDGGAVLIASGPDLAANGSIARTPLASVLPAEPTGKVIEEPFFPRVSALGNRHPVTRDLPGAGFDPPRWSRFFRMAEVTPSGGSVVMNGAGGRPLLILAREGKGRVGLMTSDHVWLWARGYDGGGPHLSVLRRLSHWLMQEPELEEEALRLSLRGRELGIERQTLGDKVEPVDLTSPSGQRRTLTLADAGAGLWRADVAAAELGLWRATDGTRTALINVGPVNPREWQDVLSTTEPTRSIARASGGTVHRIADAGSVALPRVIATRAGNALGGSDWVGLRLSDATVLKGVDRLPLFAGLLGLALLVLAISAMWWREGR
ncbi:MAG: hypothetical protein JNM13_07560 [Hyphomicrobiaceae bacterium]|nr:hypothetical protein [Hyphomicrobiaceae bacterium]